MTLNEREKRIVELTKRLVGIKVEALPEHKAGFNWGFLWAHIELRRAQKNGKVKIFTVKQCLGSYCPANWNAVTEAARTVDGVTFAYYNMD